MSNVFRQGVFDFTQGADFGFESFVFGFFAGEVVAREGGAVFDACGGEQVGDFAELAFFALEVFDFDETLFDERGDEVVGFAFAHAQQGGEFALGDVGVLFNRPQDAEVDLFACFHGAEEITVAQKWADYTEEAGWGQRQGQGKMGYRDEALFSY